MDMKELVEMIYGMKREVFLYRVVCESLCDFASLVDEHG